jgi:hypothetical protein
MNMGCDPKVMVVKSINIMGEKGPAPAINLTNSQRHVNKAAYAPAKLPPGAPHPPQLLEKRPPLYSRFKFVYWRSPKEC